jgi:TRAP-type C4-dicarboxylate transport system substrate-binding protein
MTKPQAHAYLGAIAIAAIFGVYALGFAPEAKSDSPRAVRWLLAHEPADVYARAIDVFAKEIEKESDGRMRLETVTPSQLGIAGQAGHEEILQLLESGAVELSSTFGVANGTNDVRFWAWQLPFLFENYSEVEAAFDSTVGEQLLAGLGENAPFRALAYTLSGGLRVIASSHELRSIEDLRGLRCARTAHKSHKRDQP